MNKRDILKTRYHSLKMKAEIPSEQKVVLKKIFG